MRYFLILLGLSAQVMLYGQAKIDQSFDLQKAKVIKFDFKWPKLIKLTSWEGDQVNISGTATLNNGEHDDAFKIKSSRSDGILNIYSEIEDLENLPERIAIKRDGMEYFFNTENWNDPEVQKFLDRDGRKGYEYMSKGVIKDIKLEIRVPKGQKVVLASKYGLLEVTGLENDLEANAKYGGIDVTLAGKKKAIVAKTKFGEIYSNLPYDLKSNRTDFSNNHKWTVVRSETGNSAGALELESKYGNVFLRKEE
ncbi:MAG: hypothetical protein MJA30_19870 [Cytophagales bacterium]|nr:hypothetical protein [Cytophagales bacterium]